MITDPAIRRTMRSDIEQPSTSTRGEGFYWVVLGAPGDRLLGSAASGGWLAIPSRDSRRR